jgi:hypothetical protein
MIALQLAMVALEYASPVGKSNNYVDGGIVFCHEFD